MRPMYGPLGGCAALIALFLSAAPAAAQADYWWNPPTGGSGTWNNPSMWSDTSTAAPTYTWANTGFERANFGNTAGTVTLSAPTTAFGLVFTTTNYTITGNTLTLFGSGGDINTVGTAVTATINSVIDEANGVGLTKSGTGTLTLTGANLYAGATNVNAGVLAISNGSGLGTTAGATLVTSGAALQVSGAITVAESITLNGTGVSNAGALWKTGSNTTTWTGAITLGSAARINSDAGTLTISTGGISATNQNLTIGGAGNTTVSGVIGTGSGSLTKDGAGTLTLSGANTYTGATTVTTGILAISNASALGTTAGATTVASGAALQVSGGITLGEAVTLNGTGVSSGGALRSTSGNNTWNGAITLGSAVRINSDAGTLTIATAGITAVDKDLTVGGAGNTSISAPIATGAGTLTKDGVGTVTLSGTNTYTGATTVNAGVLQFNNAGAVGGAGASVTVNTTATAAAGYAIDQPFLNRIAGSSAGVVALGADSGNALDFSATGANLTAARLGAVGAFTYSGLLTPNGTTYLLGGGGGTLTVSSVLADVPAGATALDVGLNGTAAGVVILTNVANTYTGGTTVGGGVLQFNDPGEIGGTGANVTVTSAAAAAAGYPIDQAFLGRIVNTSAGTIALAVNSGNALDFSATGANLTAARLGAVGAATYSGTLTPNGTTYRLGGGTGTLTVSSALIDVGGATALDVGISGITGTVVLTGTNTFTGGVTINGGVLQPGTATALNGNAVAFGAGSTGILRLNGTSITIGGLSTNATPGTTFVENGAATAATLTVNVASGSQTYAGVIRNGSTGALALTKTGAGTQALSGANLYTGVTTVSGGVLAISSNGALGSNTVNTTVASGAAVQISGGINTSEPLTLNGTGVSTGGALRNTSGTNTWSGAVTLGSATLINSDAGTLTISGGVSGTNQTLTVGGAGDTTISGVIATGTARVIKEGAGTLTLTGANTFSGGVTINGGVISVPSVLSNTAGAADRLGTVPATPVPDYVIITNGGVLRNTNTGTAGSSFVTTNRGITIGTGGGVLDLPDAAAGTFLIYGGVVAQGANSLTKTGVAILALSGTTTGTGPIFINQGALRLRTSGERISDSSPVTVASGATFDLSNAGASGFTETIGSIAGAGNITLGTIGRLISGGDNSSTTFSGVISGANTTGGITKSGTGTLALSGNNTYTGTTAISAGAIAAQHNNALGTAAGATTVSTGAALLIDGSGLAIAEPLNLNGTGITAGGAVRNLANANTLSGAITLASAARVNSDAGTLTVNGGLSGAFDLTVGGAGNTTVNGVIATGTGALTKDGAGLLNLTNTNTYTGTTALNGGTTVFSALGNLGNGTAINFGGGTLRYASGNMADISVRTVTVGAGGGTIDTNGNNVTLANPIGNSGTGGLTKAGTGTFVLAADNTYAGGTTVSGGTLQLGNGGTTGSITGNVGLTSVSSVLQFNRSDTYTVGGVISGTGSVVQTGTGTTVLTGNNTYSGGTTVNGGTLLANTQTGADSGTGTFGVTVNSGGTLGGNGRVGVELGNAVNVNPGGTLRPGDAAGVGQLGINSGLNMLSGSKFAVRINAPGPGGVAANSGGSSDSLIAPTNHNYLQVNGSTFINSGMNVIVDVTGLTFEQEKLYSYKVAQFGDDQSGVAIPTAQFTFVGLPNGVFSASLNGNSSGALFLNFTPAPEPGTVLAFAAAGLGLGGLLRRRLGRRTS